MSDPAGLVNRRFLLLVSGEALSIIGDQLTRIAAIWLILEIASNPAAVGFWLAAGAIPRAVFMLIGGAVSDRLSSRPVMIATNLARLALVAALAAGAALDAVTMPVLYLFAVLFGTAGAFYAPALSSILPRLVGPARLQRANSIVQGLMQLGGVIGPPVAALLLAWLLPDPVGANLAGSTGQRAYGMVFALDALTFAVSVWTLRAMGPAQGERPARPPRAGALLGDIGEGLRHVARAPRLRAFLLIALTANIGLGGPIAVGLPLIAKFALPQGVTALGILSAAAAAGGMAGLVLAGAASVRNEAVLLALPYALMIVLGGLMIALGQTTTLAAAAAVIAAMTLLAAYLDIQLITWLQTRTAPDYLGRVMGLLQFAALGLAPASMALAGLFGEATRALFLVFGSFTILAGAALWLARPAPARPDCGPGSAARS